MKKVLLAIGMCLVSVLSARAQAWTDGTNASYVINAPVSSGFAATNYRLTGSTDVWITGFRVFRGTSLDFSIGTGAGSEKFTIQQSGNVGIGATAPASALEVSRGTNTTVTISGDGGLGTAFLNFAADSSQTKSQVGGGKYGASGGFLQFSTLTSGAITEKVRIDTNGNVGIGTTTPLASLSIAGGIGPAHQIGILGNAGSQGNKSGVFLGSNGNFTGTAATAYFGLMGSPNGYLNDFALVGSSDAQTQRYLRIGYTEGDDPSSQFHSKVSINTITGDLQTSGNITADGTVRATFQDVAEWVPVLEQMTPGTVVVVSDSTKNTVSPSNSAYDTRVAGVVSPAPGLLLGVESFSKAKIATTGRVKVRADASRGAIHLGDLLVTSDTPGTAMKSEPLDLGGVKIHRPGTLIGKALEPLAKGQGEILVLLSLQ